MGPHAPPCRGVASSWVLGSTPMHGARRRLRRVQTAQKTVKPQPIGVCRPRTAETQGTPPLPPTEQRLGKGKKGEQKNSLKGNRRPQTLSSLPPGVSMNDSLILGSKADSWALACLPADSDCLDPGLLQFSSAPLGQAEVSTPGLGHRRPQRMRRWSAVPRVP